MSGQSRIFDYRLATNGECQRAWACGSLHLMLHHGNKTDKYRNCGRVTLVLYRRRAFTTELEVRRAMGRAFDTAVRRKPLAGAADAVYGNSIDFRLEIVARSGIRQNRCY